MILVTGAGGFIGRQVCTLLSRQNADVLGVDRYFSEPLPCQTLTAELTDPHFVVYLFREYPFEAVVHLASLLKTASLQDPSDAMHINIGVSLRLLELAVRNGISRFVYGSSISVYGTKRFSEFGTISERTPASPEDVYGDSKRFVEIAGKSYRQQAGLQFVALRISTVVGAGAHSKTSRWRSEIFEKLVSRHPARIDLPFLADEILPLVHVDGVADVLWKLLVGIEISLTGVTTQEQIWLSGLPRGLIIPISSDALIGFFE